MSKNHGSKNSDEEKKDQIIDLKMNICTNMNLINWNMWIKKYHSAERVSIVLQ